METAAASAAIAGVHRQPGISLATTAHLPVPCGWLVLEIVLQGQLRLFDSGRLYKAGRGELLLLTAGPIREATADYRALQLYITPDYCQYCLLPMVLQEKTPIDGRVLNSVMYPGMGTKINKLIAQLDLANSESELTARYLAKELLLGTLLRETGGLPADWTPASEPLSVPAMGYFLEANFTSSLTVPQLAAVTGKSLSAFKRDFGALYGKPPLQWLIARRLDYAYCLIRFTRYSIPTIAELCGFS